MLSWFRFDGLVTFFSMNSDRLRMCEQQKMLLPASGTKSLLTTRHSQTLHPLSDTDHVSPRWFFYKGLEEVFWGMLWTRCDFFFLCNYDWTLKSFFSFNIFFFVSLCHHVREFLSFNLSVIFEKTIHFLSKDKNLLWTFPVQLFLTNFAV